MNLTEQLTDYVNAAFSGLWVVSQRARRGRTRDRPARPAAAVEGRRLGRRQRPALPANPGAVRARRRPRRPPGRPARPAGPGRARRHGPACSCTTSTVLDQPGGDPDHVHPARRRQAAAHLPRGPVRPWCRSPSSWRSSSWCWSTPCPTASSCERIARELTSDSPEDLPQGEDLQRVLDAAAGLTRYEAEGAFALSLTRHNAIRPESIWELKAQALKKNNLLTLHRGERTLRRPGRAGQPQGLLPPGPARRANAASSRAACCLLGRPGHREDRRSPRPWATKRAGPRCAGPGRPVRLSLVGADRGRTCGRPCRSPMP